MGLYTGKSSPALDLIWHYFPIIELYLIQIENDKGHYNLSYSRHAILRQNELCLRIVCKKDLSVIDLSADFFFCQ